MNIQYASDLHLEFLENKNFLKIYPIKPVAETLVLSGDIVPFAIMDKHKDFFKYLSDSFKITYWVPGNHEYYHFDLSQKSGIVNEKIRRNVFLVNNTSIIHENVKLIFSTLWSHIGTQNEWQIERGMQDFKVIRNNRFRLGPEVYNNLHKDCLEFIKTEVKNTNKLKLCVFTHHCPTFLNYPEQYKNSVLNEAFAVELHDFIEKSNIDTWVYGHHHQNTPNFKIGDTYLLTNQLGYVHYSEHKDFVQDQFFEV